MLTEHPHVVQRLREEILDKVSNGRPTFEQMKDMKYLRAFINGTLYDLSLMYDRGSWRNRNSEAIPRYVSFPDLNNITSHPYNDITQPVQHTVRTLVIV